jgi:NitT/TauT family transport system permease protein
MAWELREQSSTLRPDERTAEPLIVVGRADCRLNQASDSPGLASVDRFAVVLFRSLGANRWQTLVKLKLPNALPYIFAGLETAAVFSVVGAAVGKYLGGGQGLGELVRLSAQQLSLDGVFALIFYLSLLGLGLFGFVTLLERRLVFWHKSDPPEITSA